jgi:hypothetical protein
MSNRTMVMFYKGNGKPLCKACKVTLKDGSERQFKSANEYKAWRKQMKQAQKKARKAV